MIDVFKAKESHIFSKPSDLFQASHIQCLILQLARIVCGALPGSVPEVRYIIAARSTAHLAESHLSR